MNNLSRVIVSMVYYNSLVRDTLEYTIPKETYDVNFYNYKQNGIVNEIKLNTPLKNFIERNEEKGEELRKKLEDFGNDFYSDNSTVIKKASDGLRVDQAQHIKIFESVIPLHEELNTVVNLHINVARRDNLLEDKIVKLKEADEKYYRAVAILALSGEMFRLFDEFQKVMRESNGQKTPQSNFVEQDLNKVSNLLNTVRQYATCNDYEYSDAVDAVFDAMEMMNGKRRIPVGKTFNDVINNVNAKVGAFVQMSEAQWKEVYPQLINELIEDNKKAQEEANKNTSTNTETPTESK